MRQSSENEKNFREAAHETNSEKITQEVILHNTRNGTAPGAVRSKAWVGLHTAQSPDLRDGRFSSADNERKSIGKVLMKHFRYKATTPSASAFVQQRQKLLPSAMEELLRRFTSSLHTDRTFHGYRLLAIDGSALKSSAYPKDTASYRPGTPRQHGWNLWHMNALYDLENGIYTDVLVQKEHEKNESRALCAMVDRSDIEPPQ